MCVMFHKLIDLITSHMYVAKLPGKTVKLKRGIIVTDRCDFCDFYRFNMTGNDILCLKLSCNQ